MAFDKRLLSIVACPVCKGELKLVTVSSQEDASQNVSSQNREELVCKFDRLAYEIKDNIPVLLEDKARELSLDELESIK